MNIDTPARSAPQIVALVDLRHPRVTRVTRVTSESVTNRGSVKIREGSVKSTVKLTIRGHFGVNNKYQQSLIIINVTQAIS